MMYDYAISYNYTTTNFPRQIRGFSDRIFQEETAKPISEIVYDSAAKNDVIHKALKQYEKTGNTAYLGICLNFTLPHASMMMALLTLSGKKSKHT